MHVTYPRHIPNGLPNVLVVDDALTLRASFATGSDLLQIFAASGRSGPTLNRESVEFVRADHLFDSTKFNVYHLRLRHFALILGPGRTNFRNYPMSDVLNDVFPGVTFLSVFLMMGFNDLAQMSNPPSRDALVNFRSFLGHSLDTAYSAFVTALDKLRGELDCTVFYLGHGGARILPAVSIPSGNRDWASCSLSELSLFMTSRFRAATHRFGRFLPLEYTWIPMVPDKTAHYSFTNANQALFVVVPAYCRDVALCVAAGLNFIRPDLALRFFSCPGQFSIQAYGGGFTRPISPWRFPHLHRAASCDLEGVIFPAPTGLSALRYDFETLPGYNVCFTDVLKVVAFIVQLPLLNFSCMATVWLPFIVGKGTVPVVE